MPRDVKPVKGPQFYRGDDGEALFTFVIDPGSVIGPHKARQVDRERHPEAWAAFVASEAATDDSDEVVSNDPVSDVASEAAVGPTPKRRGPGRPRNKGAGNDASDHRPKRV